MQDEHRLRPWSAPQRPTDRPDLTEIVAEILVGEYPTAADIEWLCDVHHINAVLSLQDDGDLLSKGLSLRELEDTYRRHDVLFERLPITDYDPDMLASRLDRAVASLDAHVRDGRRVYLHCNAGMNRAPTIAIAYLHVQRGLTLAEARDHVKQRRTCVPYMSVLEAHYKTRSAAPSSPHPSRPGGLANAVKPGLKD